jgi:hypothetical protein
MSITALSPSRLAKSTQSASGLGLAAGLSSMQVRGSTGSAISVSVVYSVTLLYWHGKTYDMCARRVENRMDLSVVTLSSLNPSLAHLCRAADVRWRIHPRCKLVLQTTILTLLFSLSLTATAAAGQVGVIAAPQRLRSNSVQAVLPLQVRVTGTDV